MNASSNGSSNAINRLSSTSREIRLKVSRTLTHHLSHLSGTHSLSDTQCPTPYLHPLSILSHKRNETKNKADLVKVKIKHSLPHPYLLQIRQTEIQDFITSDNSTEIGRQIGRSTHSYLTHPKPPPSLPPLSFRSPSHLTDHSQSCTVPKIKMGGREKIIKERVRAPVKHVADTRCREIF